jgi:F420-dependent oxidoreductase-like protein
MDLADVPDPVEKYETMCRCAREAEAAGFDAIWLFDHFHTVPTPRLEATFECWTAMAALARDTRTVRLGQMVTCNGYRPPSLLAKMASCVDVMSHGRLVLGMGAGWYEHEYVAYGYDYPDVGERLRMLREALQVVKAMWSEERASFEGRRYRLREAINEPKPVQRPHPPLWVGGDGERVTLKLVALHADGCNVGGDPANVRHKLEVLRRHCEEAGRDYGSIVKSTSLSVILGDPSEVAAGVAATARRTGSSEEAVRTATVTGDAASIAGRIAEYAEAGADYVIVYLPEMATEGVIRRFAEEVVPRLR